jgi:hypothetical protein
MGSDDDACDLTIAAKVACDIPHLGDLGKFLIQHRSQLYAMEFLPSPARELVTDTTITTEQRCPFGLPWTNDRSIASST